MNTYLLALSALALSCMLPGQSSHPPQLLGFAQSFGPSQFNVVQNQSVASECTVTTVRCSALLGPPHLYAGGTAYDPRRHSVWITNGTLVQELDPLQCSVLCSFTAQLMNSAAVVSGLAMFDGGRRLLQLETAPGYLGLRSYDTTVCPPVPLRDGCSITLPTGAIAAGLDVDPFRNVIFYTVSSPTLIDWQSELIVASNTNRCIELCRVTLPRCGPLYPRAGVVTGLAYDSCADRLYATNGQGTAGYDVLETLRCSLAQVWCCPTGSTFEFAGLAFVPGRTEQRLGQGCAPPRCAPCTPQMTLTGGALLPGNHDFTFLLEQAEVGAAASLVLSGGACTAGTSLPFLCGPLLPGLQTLPFVSPALLITGTGTGCVGAARLAVPLPLDASLCGARLCAQWVVACSSVPGALGLSDAVEFVIGS